MWTPLPIEKFVEHQLKTKFQNSGVSGWAQYITLRDTLTTHVLPWIQSQEPTLTDHGLDHIANVMDNARQLLGLPSEHGCEEDWKLPDAYTPQELLLLLYGCLTHDIGNLLGRDRHNQNISKVAELAGPAWTVLKVSDRKVIEAIGRAHTGKSPDGTKDTLEPLSKQPMHFGAQPIRAGELGALLRFADELAEGPQRTSAALIAANLIPEGSKLYHQYAEIVTHQIDYGGGRILLTFEIDINNSSYPSDLLGKRDLIKSLIRMSYDRASKLNSERQYARHYSSALSHFRETWISLTFNENGHHLPEHDKNAVISDAKTAFDHRVSIENIDTSFAVDDVVMRILPGA